MKKLAKNIQTTEKTPISWNDVIAELKFLRKSYKAELKRSPAYSKEKIMEMEYDIERIDKLIDGTFPSWGKIDEAVEAFTNCLSLGKKEGLEILERAEPLMKARSILKAAIKGIRKEYCWYLWEDMFEKLESNLEKYRSDAREYYKPDKNNAGAQSHLREYEKLVDYLEKEVKSLHPGMYFSKDW